MTRAKTADVALKLGSVGRGVACLGVGMLGVLLVLLVLAGSARAEFGVSPDPSDPTQPDFHVEIVQQDGVTPYTQAAGHPFAIKTKVSFNAVPMGNAPDENVKTIRVDLPTGFVGDPTATPSCTFGEMLRGTLEVTACPPDTQVGTVTLLAGLGDFFPPLPLGPLPVYNMAPLEGDAATFAFVVQGVILALHARIRNETDNGVTVTVKDANTLIPLLGTSLTLWGVPAAPAHDVERGACLVFGGSCPSGVALKPLLTNPADCGVGPGTSSLSIDSWQNPGVFKQYATTLPSGLDGCERLQFTPTLTARPTTSRAGAPSGYVVDLDVPQNGDFDGLATPALRKAVVTLPEGVALSPSAADGLAGCSDAQFAQRSREASVCPRNAKVGTVRITTPLLSDPLEGSVFIGQPIPGRMFRIFLEAAGSNVRIKLVGNIDLDPVTGQVTTTFDQTPQLPFSHLQLSLKGGDRASLVNPTACGTYSTTAAFTPYSAPTTPVAHTSDTFAVSFDGSGAPCPGRGFSPSLSAGSLSPIAGTSTPFILDVSRSDAEQELRSISVNLPKGLLAKVAGVPLCAEIRAAAGACDEGSRIGTVTTAAGPGPSPFQLKGSVYLTASYRGAPFGLAIVVPAVAGPFDLGTVVVRAALQIDRHTAVLRVVADPIPSILQGVPIAVRTVNVTVDRASFTRNPTNCDEKAISASIASTQGTVTKATAPFNVADCSRLSFNPQMSIKVGGKGRTTRGSSTPLNTTVRMAPGQTNLRSVKVVLPRTLNALLPVIERACTLQEFEAQNCAGARAGSAIAVTPLLDRPLRGSVFFVKNPERPLPDLVVALRGQVDFDLTGKVSIPGGERLATNFDAIPDVPVSRFTLSLVAGRNGPLGVAENLCKQESRRAAAELTLRAQSGRVLRRSLRLKTGGCSRTRR